MAVLTPSYRADYELFRELHGSVIAYAGNDVRHHVVVPRRDLDLFRAIESPTLVVHSVDEYLPHSFVSTYGAAGMLRSLPWAAKLSKVQAINLRRPWPPIRGWVLQQVIKLAAASSLREDVALLIDSDVVLIQPVVAGDFFRNDAVRFYRLPNGVDKGMPRHSKWAHAADRLLGIEGGLQYQRNDYIAAFVTWSPEIVRRTLKRVEDVCDCDWRSAVTRELHFSECFLYGTYVDRLGTAADRSFASPHTLCHSRWGSGQLDATAASEFARSIQPHDVAIQIQSTSQTPASLRRTIVKSALRQERKD